MNAIAKDAARYAGLPQEERAARVRHETQLETRVRRVRLSEVCWKCTHCRRGRVTIQAHYSATGKFLATSGLCTTPGCLDWGNP